MSVFDLDTVTMVDADTVTLVNPKMTGSETKPRMIAHPSEHNHLPSDHMHRHHDSGSSQLSTSTDSSPTTLSTTDSSPLTDGSPSPSPDSPIHHLVPMHTYPGTTYHAMVAPVVPLHPIAETNSPFQRPMTSPAPRRPRNMKGLSIQPPSAVTATSPTLPNIPNDPGTPAFFKPTIPSMKRKPSMLSLKTDTSDLAGRSNLEVPASPGLPPILQRRALKHSTSTPHMLSNDVSPPPHAPILPKMLERNESGLSDFLRPMKTGTKTTFDEDVHDTMSPIKAQVANFAEFEPYDERVNNEDQKSPTYPNGPVAMYDDNVFLYLEPTAAEAAQFDVVFNVAREVKNPFEEQSTTKSPSFSPALHTASTDGTFMTGRESQTSPVEVETPTTPRARPLKKPEYHHIDWDHNTDIAPDLMDLCEQIEGHTRNGKRVLIHCQQGASRSASLIIAYGLYRDGSLTVNDAYYSAQTKSKWISPNMKLMYSLQDFHKELSHKPSPPSSFKARTGRSPTKHRLTLSANSIQMDPKEPRTAPLPVESGRNDEAESPTRPRGNSSPQFPVPSGPASAPLTSSWRALGSSDTETPPGSVPMSANPSTAGPNLAEAPTVSFIAIPPEPSREPPPVPFVPISLAEVVQRPKLGMDRVKLSPLADSWTLPTDEEPRASSGIVRMHSLPLRSIQEQSVPASDATTAEPVADAAVISTVTRTVAMPVPMFSDMASLMSPRAETMTNKPTLWGSSGAPGLRFVESPPTPSVGLFSPRMGMFPKDPFAFTTRPPPVADPRSPPTQGEAPITRSIDDVI